MLHAARHGCSRRRLVAACTAAWFAAYPGGLALGDEGMWLFSDLPTEQLQAKYGFSPDAKWAEHVMLSCVRFNVGGSASFVSSTGLVLTNHHVAADTLYKLSTPEANYYESGFLAKTPEEELPAPDLELNQLVSIEDVTEQVEAAVPDDADAAAAAKARNAALAEIEKASLDATGLRSDVVTLYGGAKYHLYRYKKFTDVRLVWAPESGAAFFGGDPDNFEYPRFNLDATIFRVYENGEPAQIEHFLGWNDDGLADGELVFVAGNPGRTQRLFTASALTYLRDVRMPWVLDFLRRREVLFQQFGYNSPEAERRARDELFGIQNSRKAYTGMLGGLQKPAFMDSKRLREEEMLAQLAEQGDAKSAEYLQAFATIEEVLAERATLQNEQATLNCQYFSIAETLNLMAAEDQKPSGERMRSFRDSARESLQQQLFSPAPIYDDLELEKLADSIALLMERRGGDHPLVQTVLAGQGPRDRAAELIAGTKLGDVEVRQQLAAGGAEAIAASDDPMVVLARELEDEYRRLYEINERLDEQERQAYALIAEAKFSTEGDAVYPDATFTLRLAFGQVLGYEEDGERIPPWTTMAGAYDHEATHGAKDPWILPESWHAARDRLDGDVPLNFVCTADIIGGNSGSPVFNRDAELVGLIFDGNIQSLTADYLYTDDQGRAVSVAAGAIREALRSIYGAESLAAELGR